MKEFLRLEREKTEIHAQRIFLVTPEEWACLKENIYIIERLK